MRNWTLLSYSVWFVANITIIIVVVVFVVRCVQHNKYHNNNWLLYSAKLSVVIHTATQRSFVNSTLSTPVNLSYSSYTYNKFCDENPDDFCCFHLSVFSERNQLCVSPGGSHRQSQSNTPPFDVVISHAHFSNRQQSSNRRPEKIEKKLQKTTWIRIPIKRKMVMMTKTTHAAKNIREERYGEGE